MANLTTLPPYLHDATATELYRTPTTTQETHP
jgi:hypothetical protein